MRKTNLRDAMEGVCVGIIFCAWFTGATSEAAGIIRLPATIFLTGSIILHCVSYVKVFIQRYNGV